MSQKIRIGNHYYHHDHDREVIVTHHDEQNDIWFRGVQSRDNGGVISTTEWIKQQPYPEFLGSVEMRDYPEEWDALRGVVLERDDHRCQGCGTGTAELHVHHIVPLGAGGTNVKSNLQTLCASCHKRTHNGVTKLKGGVVTCGMLANKVQTNKKKMKSFHYCADCDTHFRASIDQHAETYHDDGLFRGVQNGDYEDYERQEQHRHS